MCDFYLFYIYACVWNYLFVVNDSKEKTKTFQNDQKTFYSTLKNAYL